MARYVFSRSHIRADGTTKPNAFLPPEDLELSVTRHAKLSVGEIWARGRAVGVASNRNLIGRADIVAQDVRRVPGMNAVHFPLPENPEHAHIVGWPPREPKEKQLHIAQLLARASNYHVAPSDASRATAEIPVPPARSAKRGCLGQFFGFRKAEFK